MKVLNPLLMLFSFLFVLSFSFSCSKKDEPIHKSEPKAIVSEWTKMSNSTHTVSGTTYVTDKIDNRITKDIIDQGRVLVYLFIDRSGIPSSSSFYRLTTSSTGGVTNGSMIFWYAAGQGNLNIHTNGALTGNKVFYSFCYVLLPENYVLPVSVDIDDYETAATYFGIKDPK